MKTTFLISLVALLTLLANATRVDAQGTDFTYQGRLLDNGTPANGGFDLQFLVYDALDGGIQQGVTLSRLGTEANNGLFTTTLDFGPGIFTGPRRWLEIRVAAVNTSAFTTLRPRQALTPTPYAMYAPEAGTAATASRVAWTALTGIPPGLADGVDDNTTYVAGSGLTLAGPSFSLDTTVTDARYWKLAGNSGTTAGVNFLGTTDNQALEFKVNGSRTLRLEPGANSPNLIGGYRGNAVAAGVEGATIAGGGTVNFAGSTYTNRVDANYGTISGGLDNTVVAFGAAIGGGRANAIQSSADYSVIAGGFSHRVETNADYATIGGGFDNTIRTNAESSTISGGRANLIGANADRATIGGGWDNFIETNADYSAIGGGVRNTAASASSSVGGGTNNVIQGRSVNATIGGGTDNTIQFNAGAATIGGGEGNTIWTNASRATIGGGAFNTIRTNADNATIGGGYLNTIQPNAIYATIAGGLHNTIRTKASRATIGGGGENTIEPDAEYSTIGGGYLNTIQPAAGYATIGGGSNNLIMAAAFAATIGGGDGNAILGGVWSTIGGGTVNTANADFAIIGGGVGNDIRTYAESSTVSGGRDNGIAGGAWYGVIAGGHGNSIGTNVGYRPGIAGAASIGGGVGNRIEANTDFATIPGGTEALADKFGQMAYASGTFSRYPGFVPGDAQTSLFVLRQTTTNATPRELFLDGSGKRMVIRENGAWTFDILIVASRSAGASVGGYQIRGVIKHNAAGLTTFIGTPVVTILGEQVAGWDVAVEADDVNEALVINVTGSATTVRWVATVRTVEVIFE